MERYILASPAILLAGYGEHKSDAIQGFTKKYGVHMLVYYEIHATMPDAILREKQMKRWNRE